MRLFALVAAVALALSALARADSVETKDILFSIPTLSNDIAAVDKMAEPPSDADYVLHEDDWRQIEFVSKSRLPEIKQTLTDLKAFEAASRSGKGWKNVYVRKVEGKPLIPSKDAVGHLEKAMNAKFGPAPVLTSVEGAGRVKDGFTLPLNGNNPTLYGVMDKGVPIILGSHPHSEPEMNRVLIAFYQLSKSDNLMLVDWRSQTVFISVGETGTIEKWKP